MFLDQSSSVGALRETCYVFWSEVSWGPLWDTWCFWIRNFAPLGPRDLNNNIQPELSAGGVKWDIEKALKCSCSNCILAVRHVTFLDQRSVEVPCETRIVFDQGFCTPWAKRFEQQYPIRAERRRHGVRHWENPKMFLSKLYLGQTIQSRPAAGRTTKGLVDKKTTSKGFLDMFKKTFWLNIFFKYSTQAFKPGLCSIV